MVEMFYYLFQSIQSFQSVQPTSQSSHLTHKSLLYISFMQRTKKQNIYVEKKCSEFQSKNHPPSFHRSQSTAMMVTHIRERLTFQSIFIGTLFCFVCLCSFRALHTGWWVDHHSQYFSSLFSWLLLIHMCNRKVLSSLLGMFLTTHTPHGAHSQHQQTKWNKTENIRQSRHGEHFNLHILI